MTEYEDPTEKNEQELNLFSDQAPENAPAQEYAADAPASSVTDTAAISPAADMQAEPAATETGPEAAKPDRTGPAQPGNDDSPVVAPPPPPRKQSTSQRPGIVSPRPGRASASPAPAASAESQRKPLPHPLQQSQTLGQMLTGIRNARGLSLEEVALTTRIRMEYLTELESDELLKTLPTVYVSAYVRKLAEVYDLSAADSETLLEKMRGETPQNPEELPEKLIESVNEGALVNEGESKRVRNITIIFFAVVGILAIALIWLVVLVAARHFRAPETVTEQNSQGEVSGAVQPAEEPVSQTVQLDESELDALIVPETPSISVLKMSKTPGVRDTP
jgi:transcriptional regulator with XRE-family HTH domain